MYCSPQRRGSWGLLMISSKMVIMNQFDVLLLSLSLLLLLLHALSWEGDTDGEKNTM